MRSTKKRRDLVDIMRAFSDYLAECRKKETHTKNTENIISSSNGGSRIGSGATALKRNAIDDRMVAEQRNKKV